jgi:predicted nucleic acid-binding protein
MILVDTSVLINYLKGDEGAKTLLFVEVMEHGVPWGISAYTYQELLQGARDEREFSDLKEYLGTQRIYFLPNDKSTFESAARLYFDLRRKGITPRGMVDVLIAFTAIRYELELLHDDKDFDAVASGASGLKIMHARRRR